MRNEIAARRSKLKDFAAAMVAKMTLLAIKEKCPEFMEIGKREYLLYAVDMSISLEREINALIDTASILLDSNLEDDQFAEIMDQETTKLAELLADVGIASYRQNHPDARTA